MWDSQKFRKLPPEMKHPKIESAHAIDNHTLLVEFDNHQKKKYDVTPFPLPKPTLQSSNGNGEKGIFHGRWT